MKRSTHFILAGAVTCALVLVAVWVLAASGGSGPVAAPVAAQGSASSSDGLSAGMVTYVDKAMPKLEKIVRKWNSGDYAAAGGLWESIGNAPASTEADFVLSEDYLEYANNVRYYVIGGGATLKDVEGSRAKAETTLADLR